MSEKHSIGAMLKLGFILALFAAAACSGLALVYQATNGIIAQHTQEDLEAALGEFFPDGDSFTDISEAVRTGIIKSPDSSVIFENAYEVKRNGRIAGAALRVARGSYGGTIRALVGVGKDGRIAGVRILEHKDTPGLGANAASPSYYVDKAAKLTFYGQFAGKSSGDPFEPKGDIIAVTASTITSAAVSRAVRASGGALVAYFAGKIPEMDANSAASPGSGHEAGGNSIEGNAK
ncbi:MAG: FMN-binding protein [Treponema sp.]|jgi:electron transport complex protein RnfG|nr:FMN-binding protein [Treponema sp.]